MDCNVRINVNFLHIFYLFNKCGLVQLCIKQNGHSNLCTTGPQLVLGSEARKRRYLTMWIFPMNRECHVLV